MSPKVVVGMMGSSVAKGSGSMATPEQVSDFLQVVKQHGVRELDTALVYNAGKSEELLAAVNARNDFLISTKAPGFSKHSLTYDNIIENSRKSHENLKQDKVDIYYIHGPDKDTPLEEQCRAFGKLYKEGRFARFGVCNLSAAEVRKIYEICKRESYPLPTVYQGSYSPVNRNPEQGLFPTLRELGIDFYAWGPLAGGLLAKPIDELLKPKEGSRYHEMPIFAQMYLKESNLAALKTMVETCQQVGISMMEATMRWMVHHARLEESDAFILGASSKEQVIATLSACEKGPLPENVVNGWDMLWRQMVDSGTALPVPT